MIPRVTQCRSTQGRATRGSRRAFLGDHNGNQPTPKEKQSLRKKIRVRIPGECTGDPASSDNSEPSHGRDAEGKAADRRAYGRASATTYHSTKSARKLAPRLAQDNELGPLDAHAYPWAWYSAFLRPSWHPLEAWPSKPRAHCPQWPLMALRCPTINASRTRDIKRHNS